MERTEDRLNAYHKEYGRRSGSTDPNKSFPAILAGHAPEDAVSPALSPLSGCVFFIPPDRSKPVMDAPVFHLTA